MKPRDPQSTVIQVRPGLPADARRIAEVHVGSWQAAYRGLLPDFHLDSLCAEKRIPTWERLLGDPVHEIFVAEASDAGVIGFASLSPPRDDDATPDTVELSSLYLAPAFWGRGAGTALVQVCIRAAEFAHYRWLTLWVLTANRRARRFYEKCGFVPDGTEKSEQRGAALVLQECRYRFDL